MRSDAIPKATFRRMNRPIAPSLITSVPSRFFEAIGEQDNRNRRWRQPYSVKIKLMGFDYVFADRGHQYLAMETEKLDYFSGNQGIDRSYSPGRVYRSKERPDRDGPIPLFLSGAPGAAPPVVCSCYIDREVRKPSCFDTYLLHSTEICSLGWTRSGWYTSRRTSLCFRRRRAFSRACVGGAGRGPNGSPSIRKSGDCWIMFHDSRSVRTTADGLVRQAPTGPTQR